MFLAEGLYAGYFWGIDSSSRNFMQWLSLVITAPVVFYSGMPFMRGAYNGLRNGSMTMGLPIALGALITYFYSAWATVNKSGDVYFDSAAMFIFLILIGRYLETASKRKAGSATERLLGLGAKTATIVRDGVRTTVPVHAVSVGDLVEVKPGEKIPVDGVLVEGESRVDESMLTGGVVAGKEGFRLAGFWCNHEYGWNIHLRDHQGWRRYRSFKDNPPCGGCPGFKGRYSEDSGQDSSLLCPCHPGGLRP